MNYISGYGNQHSKLVILADCPSYSDSVNGRLFHESRELDSCLKEAGINKLDCWLTSVSKYFVPPNIGKKRTSFLDRAKEAGIDIDKQLAELQIELNTINPNCILALGKNVLWALKGKYNITQFRGSILSSFGRKFVPTYNPLGLSLSKEVETEFIGYWNKQIIIFDMRRALYQSQFKELRLPNRTLSVAKNSFELSNFYDRYAAQSKLSVDIEAGGHCVPICIGLAFNKSHGLTVPLWNTDGISSIPDNDLVNIWKILSNILMNHDIIGQNFNYDRDKIKRLGFIIKKLHSDTMMKSFAINPELPKGLAFNTSIYTEEPFYKDEGMYEGSINDLLIGCARDACVTYEIDENMEADLEDQKDYYYNFIMKLPDLYLEIENTGFGIDETKRDGLIRKYINRDELIRYELFSLVGEELNVNSPKQVAELLYDKYKIRRGNGTSEEELTAILNLQSFKDPVQRKVIELILEGRRVRKTISTYMMALPDFDGRMKTTCFPCLETGRSKNGQQEPPIRPRVEVIDENGKKKLKDLGMAFQTITKHGDVGSDVRGMFVP